MDYKRRVIIKRPDEKFGHMTNISTTLENLQKTVEGHIEMVQIASEPHIVMLCNEEGKLRQLQPNFYFGHAFRDLICGTVIIAGADDEGELVDIPISFSTWKMLLQKWGN